jgi:hypothetical protein
MLFGSTTAAVMLVAAFVVTAHVGSGIGPDSAPVRSAALSAADR